MENEHKSKKTIPGILYLVSFAGVLVAAYLWYQYAQVEEITCQLSGCQEVRNSEYSKFLGIDVPIWGFFYYLASAVYSMSLFMQREIGRIEKSVFLLFLTGGLGFSIYLTLIEVLVIKAICQYCLISAILTLILFITGVKLYNPISLLREYKARAEID